EVLEITTGFGPAGTLEIDGTGTALTVAGHVSVAGDGTLSLAANGKTLVVNGTDGGGASLVIGDSTDNGTVILGTGGADLAGHLVLAAAGDTFNQNGAPLSVAGDLDIAAGTYTNPGPVTFDGAANQTVTISDA